jgi:hypothetical protein
MKKIEDFIGCIANRTGYPAARIIKIKDDTNTIILEDITVEKLQHVENLRTFILAWMHGRILLQDGQ